MRLTVNFPFVCSENQIFRQNQGCISFLLDYWNFRLCLLDGWISKQNNGVWVLVPSLVICQGFCYPDPYHPLRKTLLCRHFSTSARVVRPTNLFRVSFRKHIFRPNQGCTSSPWIIGISNIVSFFRGPDFTRFYGWGATFTFVF